MKKSIFVLFVLCGFTCNLLPAQSEGEEIELPDVTTVISGGALTAGKDSVPDYKKILPDKNTLTVELPQMQAVENEKIPESENLFAKEGEKDVYAEGKIGGGFPFSFTGDFSIFRATGNSPFELSFNHESYENFAGEKAADGYFLRQTGIALEQKHFTEKAGYDFSLWYKNEDRGLQSLSKSFTDYLNNDAGAKLSADWDLNKGWYIRAKANASIYNRYGIQFENGVECSNSWEESAEVFALSPEITFGWKKRGFDLSFASEYKTQLNLKDTDTLEKAPEASSAEAVHRGRFGLNFAWANDFVSVHAEAAAVIGNSTGKQNVIVPFCGGVSLLVPNSISSRKIIISAEGGLDSKLEYAGNLEKLNPFAVLYCLPSEQTDWYGSALVSLPVKERFTLNLAGEYRKTAFENGVWQADYSSSPLASGFYCIAQTERTDFNTDLNFAFDFDFVKFNGGWKAYWLDTPSFAEKQSFNFGVNFEGKDSKWNAGAALTEFLGDDADKVPVINADISVKCGKSIRLALETTDVIKLVTAKTRQFVRSQYKQNCGHVTAAVKFQF